jgi:TPR repeat protein
MKNAQCNLGVLFEKGQNAAQDYAEAVRHYSLAAAQGLADAQSNSNAQRHFPSKGLCPDTWPHVTNSHCTTA